MKILGSIGNVYYVKKIKGGVSMSLFLGKDKGNLRLLWFYKNGYFDEVADSIKDGDTVFIPSGDLSLEKYKDKNESEKNGIKLITNYLELYNNPYSTKRVEEIREKTKQIQVVEEKIRQTQNGEVFEERIDPILAKKVDIDDVDWDAVEEEVLGEIEKEIENLEKGGEN